VFELSDLVRSLTSVFQLLPTYPCVALPSGENSYLVDAPDLPHVPRERLRDAAAFHAEIRAAVAAHLRDDRYQGERYRTLPVVGTQQDTLQSANIDPNGNIKFAYQHAAQDLKGDGTVPRISATPVELSNLGVETYVATCHASIQNSHGVVYHVCESLANLYLDLVSPNYRVAQQAATTVSLDVEDAYWDDEPVRIRLKAADTPSPALHLTISNIEQGIDAGYVNFSAGHEGWMQAELPPLAAGTYRASVVDSLRTNLVTDVFVVYHRA
jgi:hypothetical protein